MSSDDARDTLIGDLETLIYKLNKSELIDYSMKYTYNKGYFNSVPFRKATGVILEVKFKENSDV